MKRINFILGFVFLSGLVLSQEKSPLDTVFCDIQNTSYINLSDEVTLVDVGNPLQYAAEIKGNLVFVKPQKENVPPTTILIKCGNIIYHGTLSYNRTGKVKSYYYEIKPGDGKEAITKKKEVRREDKNIENESETNSASSAADTSLQSKMELFSKIKPEIKTLGFISENVDAAVTVIRNDENNTYLKLAVNNKSSLPFKLDFISFQYYQDMKKGSFRKSRKAPLDVFPVGQPGLKEISPEKSQALCYVIPAYALANNGYLMVLIRESSGDRVLKIKVEDSLIQGSPRLKTEKKDEARQ